MAFHSLRTTAESPNLIGISVTGREAGGDVAQKMPGLVSSLSRKCRSSFRLPPELLATIFLEYARDSASLVYSVTVPRWISVSYVCRYWRNVALHCANLWATHLFFVSSEWMDELLRRSKNVPLIVRVDICYHSGSHVGQIHSLEKALGNMERIQDLWIECPSDMIEIIQPRLNVAAPLLRSLYLSAGMSFDGLFLINQDTLPGVMPGLRKVHLYSFRVDWSSSIFNGLTKLTLGYLFNQTLDYLNGVLRILRQLPRLRQLCLEGSVPDIGAILPTSRNENECISLPHLEKLFLAEPVSWTIALLTQLELPKSTIVQLECHCGDPQDISGLLALITDQIGNYPSMAESAQTELRYLDLDRNDDCWKFTYGASTTNAYRTDMFSHYLERLGSQITLTHMPEETDDILAWFCAFPVAQLNAIAVHDLYEDNFENEDPWTEAFQNASELHTIGVESSRFECLIRALHPHDGTIPAPNLIDINLGQIEFDRCDCSCGRDHAGKGNIQCLLYAPAKRAEAGNMLPRLDIFRCSNITEDDMMELSKVVGQLNDSSCTELGVEFEEAYQFED